MDDDGCQRFFLKPEQTFQRRYEALRAVFVAGQSAEQTAAQFGYRAAAFKSMISRFRAQCRKGDTPPFFFRTDADAPPAGAVAKTNTAPSQPTKRTAAD